VEVDMTRLEFIEQRLDQLLEQYYQKKHSAIYRLTLALLMAEKRELEAQIQEADANSMSGN
jgi:hypothetical protein